jgi:hypothetical protein
MTNFIACYDLNGTNNPHNDYLAAAIACGWSQWVKTESGKWFKLPNTTLHGNFADEVSALASFKNIKTEAEKLLGKPITMEKYFVTKYSTASVVSDDKKSTKPY